MYRIHGQDQVSIRVIISNDRSLIQRPDPVSTTIRADLSNDPEFASLLDQAHGVLGELTDQSDLLEAVALRTTGREDIPAAAFIYAHDTGSVGGTIHAVQTYQAHALSISEAHPDGIDLALIVHESDDGIQVGLSGAATVYSSAMIEALGDALQTLLFSIATDPHQPISRLNVLSASQRHQVLVEWNDTAVPFCRDIHTEQLFDMQAAAAPDRIALRYEHQAMTYGELRRRSNQLARYLRQLGVGPGKLVAVCTDRSPEMVIGLLGILKAGAAYVPLDPSYPADLLAFMLEDAHVAALVTQSQWQPCLPSTTATVVRLDSDRGVLDAQSDVDLPAAAGPDDLAYVIYTSGSTGKPKGVAIHRCAFVNFLHAMKSRLNTGEEDVFLALTTISFDIAGLELFLPLTNGGRVVLATRDDAIRPDRLALLIDEERITVMQATPATWRMLLDSSWTGRSHLCILCGGEAMTRDLADRLLRKGSSVWNMYGPTETTVWSTMCPIGHDGDPISIGRPIDNTDIYILDKHLQPVPVGAVGELYIGGVGLASEYLHRPELTAEKFIVHPFRNEPGARIYRTGDLARYWPDGRIECLGRVDHQVKIRGFRIELSEVEAHLSAHPAVRQAAAVARDDKDGDKYLAAYWVPQNSTAVPTTDELRAFIARTLPRHMVPSVFVCMPELPLTPNGKIDRKALPAPDQLLRENAVYVAPRDTLERQLVEIWESLLEARPIGIRDDFFALGGHSLAAARLVIKIEAATGASIPISSLLSAPTIEGLARIINGQEQSTSGIIVPFRRTGEAPPLFVVAGVGGHVLIFRELADLLGDDQPVYGIQGIGLDGKDTPLRRMEDIAARYLDEILAIRPHGPWVLAGWSMGGAIAYEIGQQMLARGLRPRALVFIDTYAPWSQSLWRRLRIHLDSFRQRSWRNRWEYIVQRVTHRAELMRRRLGYDNISDTLDGRTAELIRHSSLAQYEALRCYQAKSMRNDVFLLRADQGADIRDPRAHDAFLGWNSLIRGEIRVLPITGNHTGIFTGENVRVLAAALTQCIANSEGSYSSRPLSSAVKASKCAV